MDMTDAATALTGALFDTREDSEAWPKLVAALAALDETLATETVARIRQSRSPGALATL
jgi:hypothetical protein